jgi:hypothetical protein
LVPGQFGLGWVGGASRLAITSVGTSGEVGCSDYQARTYLGGGAGGGRSSRAPGATVQRAARCSNAQSRPCSNKQTIGVIRPQKAALRGLWGFHWSAAHRLVCAAGGSKSPSYIEPCGAWNTEVFGHLAVVARKRPLLIGTGSNCRRPARAFAFALVACGAGREPKWQWTRA